MQKRFLSLVFGIVIGLTVPTIAQAQNDTNPTTQTPQDYIACKALYSFSEKGTYPHKFSDNFKATFGNCQQPNATITELNTWLLNRQTSQTCKAHCKDELEDTSHIINHINNQTNPSELLNNTQHYQIVDLPSKKKTIDIQLNDDELTYLKQLAEKQKPALATGKASDTEHASSTGNTTTDQDGEKSGWFDLQNISMPFKIIFSLIALGLLAIIMYTIVKTIKTTEITTIFSDKDDNTSSTHQSTDVYEHHYSPEQEIQSLKRANQDLQHEHQDLKQKYAELERYVYSLEPHIKALEQRIHTLESNPTNFNQTSSRGQSIYDNSSTLDSRPTKRLKYFPEPAPTPEPISSDTIQTYYASMPVQKGFNMQDLTTEQCSNSLYQIEHNTRTGDVKFSFVEKNKEQASNLAIKSYDESLVPVCDIINLKTQIIDNAKTIKTITPGKARMEGDFCVVTDKCIVELLL